jgi:hypothetical protein
MLNGEERESSESKQAEVMMRMIETVRPAVRALHALGVDSQQDVLSMPEFQLQR